MAAAPAGSDRSRPCGSSRSGAARTGRSRRPGTWCSALAGSLVCGVLAARRRRAAPDRAPVGDRRRGHRPFARSAADPGAGQPERRQRGAPDEDGRVQLLITANYDAGRTGLAYRPELRRIAARLDAAIGGLVPGWLGWLTIAIVWLLAIAIARLEGSQGTAIGVLQLIPTVGLVLGLALLLELAAADFGPAAGDNGTGRRRRGRTRPRARRRTSRPCRSRGRAPGSRRRTGSVCNGTSASGANS